MRKSQITRAEAWELLKKYNQDPFHRRHALTAEGVMRYYARTLGYAEEEEYWGIVGLLHDIDFELYPEEHCRKAPELLRSRRCRRGYDPGGLLTRIRNLQRCGAGA